MAGHEPLSSKHGQPSGHFWSVWADWGMVAKVGLGFIGAIALFAGGQFYFEDGNQQQSFAAAHATIAALPLERAVTQHQAKLLKRGLLYSWRAILWVREGTTAKPKIWNAIVRHEGKYFTRVSYEISNYEQEKAYGLELFDDVSSGPPPPR